MGPGREQHSPLIVTLAVDSEAQAHFDSLRQAHFPAARNHLAAHVTLFHHLPGLEQDAVAGDVARAARRAPFTVDVTGPRSLGGGVAYGLRSADLSTLRAGLAEEWAPWLTRQDQQPFRPHVTVQNKVSAEAARTLLDRLQASFVPYSLQATGLRVWHYLGGPWQLVGDFVFSTSVT